MVSFHIGVDFRLEGENRQIADGKETIIGCNCHYLIPNENSYW